MNKPRTTASHSSVSPRLSPSVLIAVMLLLLLAMPCTTFADSATWKMSPATGDWNHAANWTPPTIPNGPSDTATFAASNTIGVSLSANTEVNGIVFNPSASAFTITAAPTLRLTISGTGITNNSEITQNFVVDADDSCDVFGYVFTNTATAGNATMFTMGGGTIPRPCPGGTRFSGMSTAGNGVFINNGGGSGSEGGGVTQFSDRSTAANGTFVTHGNTFPGIRSAEVSFGLSSSADNGHFTNNGSAVSGAVGGRTFLLGSGVVGIASTAAHATFINNGGTVSNAGGGSTELVGNLANPTAANGIFINNAGTVSGARGGGTNFSSGDAGNATLIANGGPGDGGFIHFLGNPVGGMARVKVFGNGNLDVTRVSGGPVNDTIGSIEGDGLVFLGANNLTVGSNNLTTVFSGKVQDGGAYGGTGGSLTKVGTGKLVLRHRNTYTGGTIIKRGILMVNHLGGGSGTGSGPVEVNGGRLGGMGTIAGAVTVGSGRGREAILSPGYYHSTNPGSLTIQSPLSFNSDATYEVEGNSSSATADEVVANGVTIDSGAQFSFADLGSGTLTPGTVFTVINNTAAPPIAGTFSNLPDGSIFTSNGNTYQVSYQGGDGNDLTLTVIP